MINKALRTLWIYNGIFTLAGGMFAPLYAVYVLKITPNIFIVSISWATFLISATLFEFLISRIGDKVKEKEYLLMAGFFIRAVAWIMYIFVGNVFMLIFIQVLLGFGEGMGGPSFNSLVAEHLDQGRHVEEYADMGVLFNLSSALATIIGGAVAAQFGFPTLFIVMAVLALISFFGIYFKPRALL
jgi:DHA1 family bicyclomycin/chloramphenicol resistance-like MFS transporter